MTQDLPVYKRGKAWRVRKTEEGNFLVTAWLRPNRETEKSYGLSIALEASSPPVWFPKKFVKSKRVLGLRAKGVTGYGARLVELEVAAYFFEIAGLETKADDMPELEEEGDAK